MAASQSSYESFLKQQDTRNTNAVIHGLPIHDLDANSSLNVSAVPEYIDRFNAIETFEERYDLTVQSFHRWLDEECKSSHSTTLNIQQCHERLGLALHHNPPEDGTCLYGAVVASLYGIHSPIHMKENVTALKVKFAKWMHSYLWTQCERSEVDLILSQFVADHRLVLPSQMISLSGGGGSQDDGGLQSFCAWLISPIGFMHPETWGGVLELSFLPRILGVNIIVVNTQDRLPRLFQNTAQVKDGRLGDLLALKLHTTPLLAQPTAQKASKKHPIASSSAASKPVPTKTIVLGRHKNHFIALKVQVRERFEDALWLRMAFTQIASSITDFGAIRERHAAAVSRSAQQQQGEEATVAMAEYPSDDLAEMQRVFDQVGPIILHFLDEWQLAQHYYPHPQFASL